MMSSQVSVTNEERKRYSDNGDINENLRFHLRHYYRNNIDIVSPILILLLLKREKVRVHVVIWNVIILLS